MEAEVFVHGAMCLAVSGRCLLSAWLTGRSGNRGECCHPCRFEYRPRPGSSLEVEERLRPGETTWEVEELDGFSMMFAPEDLCLVKYVPALVRLGVAALKVEGRMKSPLYVAQVTDVYRTALDDLAAGRFRPRLYLSELALGWATYNGDHMSMYGVNMSVPKTLVRHLVSYAADHAENGELAEALRDVLDTPVSPELLPPVDGVISQKTEDIVGPYELHDFFLYHLVRRMARPSKILRLAILAFQGDYDEETIEKWLRVFLKRFFQNQFKRSCIPDGPKVGSVTLSPRGDWRMPSDADSDLWLRSLR